MTASVEQDTPDHDTAGDDVDRWTSKRASYLDRTTRLSADEAAAVAYSELGHSEGGIAKRVAATESTVETYLTRAVATYGPLAAHARPTPVLDRDLAPVACEDVLGWPGGGYRERWVDAVEAHPDRAPAEIDAGGDPTAEDDSAPVAERSGRRFYLDWIQAREWWIDWVLAHPDDDGSGIDWDDEPTKQPVAPYWNGTADTVRWNFGLPDDEHPCTDFETVDR